MLVEACNEVDFDASTETCAAPYWTAPPGFFSGWTSDDLSALVGALLAAAAVAYIIRLLHRFALAE